MSVELETKIYQRGNKLNLILLVKEMLIDLYQSRFLAKQLAKRDISSSYRQSFLGIIWAFITPITTALVWIFINSSGAVSLEDTGVPYPVFVFTGTLLWSVLTESINMPITATREAKVYSVKLTFLKKRLSFLEFIKFYSIVHLKFCCLYSSLFIFKFYLR